MKEYYSPSKNQSLRNKISTFAQSPTGRSFRVLQWVHSGWRSCSKVLSWTHHGVKDDHRRIDRGSIIELTQAEAFTLFKKVADNDTWASSWRILSIQLARDVDGVNAYQVSFGLASLQVHHRRQGSLLPLSVSPRYRICGTMCNAISNLISGKYLISRGCFCI
jgi:hypothetical protein